MTMHWSHDATVAAVAMIVNRVTAIAATTNLANQWSCCLISMLLDHLWHHRLVFAQHRMEMVVQRLHYGHFDHSYAADLSLNLIPMKTLDPSSMMMPPLLSSPMMTTIHAEAFFGVMMKKKICVHLFTNEKQNTKIVCNLDWFVNENLYLPDECIEDVCLPWWWLEDRWWLDDLCCDPELCASLCKFKKTNIWNSVWIWKFATVNCMAFALCETMCTKDNTYRSRAGCC